MHAALFTVEVSVTRNSYLSCLWAVWWVGNPIVRFWLGECVNCEIGDFTGQTNLPCYPAQNYHPVLSIAKVSAINSACNFSNEVLNQ